MKIKKITIQGVGGIDNLDINFNTKMNIICGPNGIGKTTILECIAHLFSHGNSSVLKRNVNSENSLIDGVVEVNNAEVKTNLTFKEFEPDKQNNMKGRHQDANKLLSLKCNRNLNYTPLYSVSKDNNKESHAVYTESITGLNYNDIKNWFVNRYLYSAHEGALNQFQLENFSLAKRCFSVLDENFNFSKVNASTNEIMVNTPNGEIYYEYLSSGFKSCLVILFGIIKEVEYRFINPYIKAEDFDGIILIDEIELHLHPLWQSKFPSALLEIFPNAQFIVTTHSPHVVQFAERKQIIALEYIDKSISMRMQDESKYGYQGWTIEEILEDVMGMKDNRTIIFNQIINEFEKSLDDEDYTRAKEIFNELDNLLHPNNHLRKLLKFQIARIRG